MNKILVGIQKCCRKDITRDKLCLFTLTSRDKEIQHNLNEQRADGSNFYAVPILVLIVSMGTPALFFKPFDHDIDVFIQYGIRAISITFFVYWNIAKCFYKPATKFIAPVLFIAQGIWLALVMHDVIDSGHSIQTYDEI